VDKQAKPLLSKLPADYVRLSVQNSISQLFKPWIYHLDIIHLALERTIDTCENNNSSIAAN